MKPGDAPAFFRSPPPEGQSRESTIRLDREGRFFHDDSPVDHPKLAAAMHSWIRRHPDDGRFILTNGYDWTYFSVDDVPYFVLQVRPDNGDALLLLSDGSEEPLEPSTVRVSPTGALTLQVKARANGGPFAAKMTRFAQGQLGPFLGDGGDGTVFLTTRRGRAVITDP